MVPRTRVYLAGPEVFLANGRAIGAHKRAICARYGLCGIFPGDAEPPRDRTMAPPVCALSISQAMEAAMRSCDEMIVNLTPFRGISADVGSVYEVGFMRGLGRPVFGYSNDPRMYLDRVMAGHDTTLRRRPSGELEDADGMAVENFQQHDNLMLSGGIVALRGYLITASAPHTERYTSLTTFERCVATVAAQLTLT